MKQIICLSHTPWSSLRPNRTQQLLTRVDDAKILFLEPPGRSQTEAADGMRVRSNIIVHALPPLLLPGMDRPFVHRANQKRIRAHIQKLMEKHRFRDPILWCTTPENAFLIEQFSYRCLVYDCHREWDEFPLELESDLTAAADVVFAASKGLKERLAPCSANIAIVPNGVTPRMFLRGDLTAPASVSSLPRPLLARVGDLHSDLEVEPLIYTAQRRPDWTFLLIGRVTQALVQRLAPLKNVVLLGEVPAVELPDYLCGCDVLFDLIQTKQRGSDILSTRIFEYLATGKPIVSMIEPDQVEVFPDVIYTAYDSNGFLRRCQSALDESGTYTAQRRLEYARQSSWNHRAREISRILEDTGLS